MKAKKLIGRPTAEATQGKKATIGIRASADLKTQLNESAKRNGRSLSVEAELRLVQSFREEGRAALFHDAVFGRQLAGLIELTGRVLRYAPLRSMMMGTATAEGDWLAHPFDFTAAGAAMVDILAALAPPELAGAWQATRRTLASSSSPAATEWGRRLARRHLQLVAGDPEERDEELSGFGRAIRAKLGEDATRWIAARLQHTSVADKTASDA